MEKSTSTTISYKGGEGTDRERKRWKERNIREGKKEERQEKRKKERKQQKIARTKKKKRKNKQLLIKL